MFQLGISICLVPVVVHQDHERNHDAPHDIQRQNPPRLRQRPACARLNHRLPPRSTDTWTGILQLLHPCGSAFLYAVSYPTGPVSGHGIPFVSPAPSASSVEYQNGRPAPARLVFTTIRKAGRVLHFSECSSASTHTTQSPRDEERVCLGPPPPSFGRCANALPGSDADPRPKYGERPPRQRTGWFGC